MATGSYTALRVGCCPTRRPIARNCAVDASRRRAVAGTVKTRIRIGLRRLRAELEQFIRDS
jgi:hypothetical protein